MRPLRSVLSGAAPPTRGAHVHRPHAHIGRRGCAARKPPQQPAPGRRRERSHRARSPDRDPGAVVARAAHRADVRRAAFGSCAGGAPRVPGACALPDRRSRGPAGVRGRRNGARGFRRPDRRLSRGLPVRGVPRGRARRARLGPALRVDARGDAAREHRDLRAGARAARALRSAIAAPRGRAPALRSGRPREERAGFARVPLRLALRARKGRDRRVTEKTIAVLGAGIMGRGIAYAAAVGGFRTILQDVESAMLEKAVGEISATLEKGVALGKVDGAQAAAAHKCLTTTRELAEAARAADLVIEAVPEKMALKVEIFGSLDRIAPRHALLASNTSSLSITEMAAATGRAPQVLGMHFFNPVPRMKLLEVVRGLETSDAAIAAACDVGAAMGKECVVVRESPGFLTSRINAMIGNEAFYMLQEGVASARGIDKALKLGLNHPMGPFELVDLVGLDTRLAILKYLHRTLGEKYRPCPLIEQYVAAGRLGRKSGRGVYEYPPDSSARG